MQKSTQVMGREGGHKNGWAIIGTRLMMMMVVMVMMTSGILKAVDWRRFPCT